MLINRPSYYQISALFMGWIGACATPDTSPITPADTLFVGGTIYIDSETSVAQLAVRDGVVVAQGEGLDDWVGTETITIDLGTSVLTPGLHDNHTHLLAGSFVLDRLVLLGASSMDSILGSVAEYAEDEPDEPWIVGYGWIRDLIEDPSGVAIDEVVSDRPVLLADNTGHTALVNTYAMNLAGIDADTEDPEGGEVVRDENGQPTGYLIEEALTLVSEVALADYDDSLLASGMAKTLEQFSAGGITGVSEILASPGFDLARPWIYSELEASGELPLRIHYYVPIFTLEDVSDAVTYADAADGELVRLAGGKLWVDGSMGNGEAWVSEAMESDPTDFGSYYFDVLELIEIVELAEEVGLPLKMHTNGDAAVSAALDAFEAVAASNGGLGLPHVLEHVVLVSTADHERMADLGIIASVQPSHWVTAQFSDTVDEWGEERFATAYDYRALLDAGVTLSLGTDWPVWPTPDGLVQIWAAANHDESSIETAEALTAYTKGSAASVGRTLDLGALNVGMLADMVVFDADPLTAAPEDLTDINVTKVYVAGDRVD